MFALFVLISRPKLISEMQFKPVVNQVIQKKPKAIISKGPKKPSFKICKRVSSEKEVETIDKGNLASANNLVPQISEEDYLKEKAKKSSEYEEARLRILGAQNANEESQNEVNFKGNHPPKYYSYYTDIDPEFRRDDYSHLNNGFPPSYAFQANSMANIGNGNFMNPLQFNNHHIDKNGFNQNQSENLYHGSYGGEYKEDHPPERKQDQKQVNEEEKILKEKGIDFDEDSFPAL